AWMLTGGLFLGYVMTFNPDRYEDAAYLSHFMKIPGQSSTHAASFRLALGLCLGASMLLFVRWLKTSAAAWIAAGLAQEAYGRQGDAGQVTLQRACIVGVGVGRGWFTFWLAPVVTVCMKGADGLMLLMSAVMAPQGLVQALAIDLVYVMSHVLLFPVGFYALV